MRSEGSFEDPSGLALHIEPCMEPETFKPRCLVSEMDNKQTVCVNRLWNQVGLEVQLLWPFPSEYVICQDGSVGKGDGHQAT